MGQLTEDMTRLAAEINSGRSDRARLMREVKQATTEMKRAVAQMNARFHAAHAHMAREQQQRLRGFVSGLHNTVAGLRGAFASDLAGARAAFFGTAVAAAGRGHSKRGSRSFTSEAA
jgi:hypothetical protein